MKVRDLVEHLLSGDQNAEVIVLDHFGRSIEVTKEDFTFYRGQNQQEVVENFCLMRAVDIGPEPE